MLLAPLNPSILRLDLVEWSAGGGALGIVSEPSANLTLDKPHLL
jgi:hypothetical protein